MKGIGKLNDRHKRLLVVAGCTMLCAVLVVTIGVKFQTAAQTGGTVPSSSKAGAVVPSTTTGTAGTTSDNANVTV